MINNFYIYIGEERKMMEYSIKELASKENATIKYVSPDELSYKLVTGTSLFTNNNLFIVKDNVEKLDTNKIIHLLESKKHTFVVLILDKLDKRLSFYKDNKKYIREFNKLSENELVKFYGDNIYHTTLRELVQRCDCDMGRIESEINKAKNLNSGEVLSDSIKYLLDNNLIYKEPLDAVFLLVDAILKFKPELAYEMYDNCKRIGEANLVILTNLFTSAKHLLQVQSYQGKNVNRDTGLNDWQINLVKDKVGINTNRRLINIMKLVQKIEEGIKKGVVDDELSVDLILANVFKEVNVYEG